METPHSKALPFSTRVLQTTGVTKTDDDLLPASYRGKAGDGPIRLYIPSGRDSVFLKQELDVQRLRSVFHWLWIAGRPMPPRPLHYQLMLGRDIVITEDMNMHLVWTAGRIFLKPVPRYLLEPAFWGECLSCPRDYPCLDDRDCRQGLRRLALGFLSSYVAMISYESDFMIAQERHLLPEEVKWRHWRSLASEILSIEDIDRQVDARFLYGELRLGRLNKIYILSGRSVFRGYMPNWQQYGAYFQDNLAWLATATIYIAVVLTAMQVGLATSLGENAVFQLVSLGFTVFSILAPPVAAVIILLVFILLFIDNWVEAVSFKKRRFEGLHAWI
ncbi:hypothetical protein KVR01_010251 [Diaporthe batatas]|uniref:uncharacterized protein n=1 Tax=Diaporthe batatas TaxID=748121 RepID=UPI001D04D8C9|nr:uncharacterized protein KVR01_010251 [Diaporthe batatas]KAG8159614.1 hypothetical protein KVR01_010251 [Diaporthe batatas]